MLPCNPGRILNSSVMTPVFVLQFSERLPTSGFLTQALRRQLVLAPSTDPWLSGAKTCLPARSGRALPTAPSPMCRLRLQSVPNGLKSMFAPMSVSHRFTGTCQSAFSPGEAVTGFR